ncbi:MAG: hypothetical protein M1820_006783 [Bogoriella megaspora]|nr:MAG: hypothetical protein M1820_006783 [Bogoriella megaspora]
MLDEEHLTARYDTNYDDNTYRCGELSGHTVVLATCPKGMTGNVNAARLTASMFKTFPNIRIALLVGIGGGVPKKESSDNALEDVHLGDVVVGWSGDGQPAVVEYDQGRAKVDGFQLVGTTDRADWRLTEALSVLRSDHDMHKTNFKD